MAEEERVAAASSPPSSKTAVAPPLPSPSLASALPEDFMLDFIDTVRMAFGAGSDPHLRHCYGEGLHPTKITPVELLRPILHASVLLMCTPGLVRQVMGVAGCLPTC